jgi:anthranilate phosphoribosyltransferase
MDENIKFAEKLQTNSCLHEAIYRINVGLDLSEELVYEAFTEILHTENQVDRGIFMGVLLNGLMAKKPTSAEAKGAIRAALALDGVDPHKYEAINLPGPVIGLAGSGKKGIKSMNISSCAAMIAACADVYIAKSCSSSTSSVTGSSDFIEILGANLKHSKEDMIEIMRQTKLGFFKIENLIPHFDSVYGGKFYAPHVLSFGLAGIVLPFKPDNMLYGLAHPNIGLVTRVFKKFGYENLMAVSTTDNGIHFLDEVGVFGVTSIMGIRDGEIGEIAHLQPGVSLDFPRYSRSSIKPGVTVEENIALAIDVLLGKGERARTDIVCINAATLLYLGKKVKSLTEGYRLATEIISSGAPVQKLKEFIIATEGDVNNFNYFLKNVHEISYSIATN